jgi:NADPH-dependent 2,4-dienoyl-CoA reductase/sulfur reductase-like enzyme
MTMRPPDPDPVAETTAGVAAVAAPAALPGSATVETDHAGWFDTGGAPVAAFDVAVIGAGPAGLAASVAAVEGDARVVLIDASPRIGGQYWRHRAGDDGTRHHAWPAFVRLHTAVETAIAAGTLVHLPALQVWHVSERPDGFVVHALDGRHGREVRARTVILATGAFDRQLPFPGWTLPGVYTAGAAQALLKGQGVVVGTRIVVAGTGPFLLPVATGLAEAGATVVGVFEAGRPTAFARHPLTMLRSISKLREGAGYLRVLRAHGVPYRTRSTVIEALGDEAVTRVRVARLDPGWRIAPGSERELECDAVAVGYGFTPQPELALQLGCDHVLDPDGSLVATVDDDQASTVTGVFIAGEATGVGGAELAQAEGEIAGFAAAARGLGRTMDRGATRPARGRRGGGRAFATALQEAFPVPGGWLRWLTPETVVCRCEEVSVGQVDAAMTDLGAADVRTVKLLARPGMGLCQGRVCGYATACLVADRAGRAVSAADVLALASRPIAQPVPLGVLAADADTHADADGDGA